MNTESGTLYLVATPIGNYKDITYRALRILKEVEIIVYEERKEGERLLAHYGIQKTETEMMNEHNEEEITPRIIERLQQGKNVALISDAGTPIFSDPGQFLVRNAIESKIKIVPIPGVSSLVPALVLSGFPIHEFLFYGFLSPKKEQRISELRQLRGEHRPIVLMDTPYRLLPVIKDVAEVFGNQRRLCVATNLTMPDEQVYRGTADELLKLFQEENLKCEFVIVVEGTGKRPSKQKRIPTF